MMLVIIISIVSRFLRLKKREMWCFYKVAGSADYSVKNICQIKVQYFDLLYKAKVIKSFKTIGFISLSLNLLTKLNYVVVA